MKVSFNLITREIEVIEVPVLIPPDAGFPPPVEDRFETQLSAQVDLYSETKEFWRGSAAASKLIFPFQSTGGDDIGSAGTNGAYFFFRTDLGWTILPYDSDHRLVVVGNLFPHPSRPNLPLFKKRPGRTVEFERLVTNLASSPPASATAQAVWGDANTYPIGTKGRKVDKIQRRI